MRDVVTSTGEASGMTAGKRPTLKWYWNLGGALLLGLSVFLMLMPVWDSMGIESVRCEVASAKGETNSGGSRGSASTPGVLVETTDCGRISISEGVTFDNRGVIAASFEPGSEYEFDIGWFSRVVLRDIQRGVPTAQDYRKVQ